MKKQTQKLFRITSGNSSEGLTVKSEECMYTNGYCGRGQGHCGRGGSSYRNNFFKKDED